MKKTHVEIVHEVMERYPTPADCKPEPFTIQKMKDGKVKVTPNQNTDLTIREHLKTITNKNA